MQLVIDRQGQIRCLYEEALDLRTLGKPTLARASHVEPDSDGHWWADLSPVSGPRLGPFPRRSAALACERDWLGRHWLERQTRRSDDGATGQ
jgi:hypothetical protein